MKYLLIFIASINIAFAQTERITHPELDRFAGKWTGTVENETITIVLKRGDISIPNFPVIKEGLFGYHEYKVGNIIKESTLSDSNHSFSGKKWTVLAGYIGGYGGNPIQDYNAVKGTLCERGSDRSQVLRIKKQGDKLLLTLEGPVHGIRINGSTKPLVLPQNKTFTLTKVN